MNPTPADRAKLIEDANLVFPGAPMHWWVISLLAALSIVAVLAAWRIFRWRRGLPSSAEPPHAVALRALATLLCQIEEISAHAFALQISSVLRVYIEARFGLRAPHRSTEEFLSEAEHSARLSLDQRSMVGEFLRRCDRVKFALGELSHEHKLALHASASHFVEETVVRPAMPGASSKKIPALQRTAPAVNEPAATV